MHRYHLSRWILAADTAWIVLALAGSYALRFWLWHGRSAPVASVYALLGLGTILVWAAIYRAMGLDCFRGGWQWTAALSRVATGVALLMAGLLAFAYLAQVAYSRLLLAGFGVLLAFGFALTRIAMLRWVLHRRRQGAARRVVLVGNDHVTRELVLLLGRHPEFFYEVVGVAYPYGAGGAPLPEFAVAETGPIGSLALLERLRRERVDEVLLLLQDMPQREFQNFLSECAQRGITVRMVPRSYQLYVSRPRLVEVGGVPLLSVDPAAGSPMAALKRPMDLAVAMLIGPAVLVLTGLIALALRWGGYRPTLGYELRCGQAGTPFRMWRFNVQRDGGRRLERWLAQTSLSELPQFWNVLRGEMSLVGPRPESPARVKHYSSWEAQRLRSAPGVTGLAQVHGLREANTTREKARFDLQYLSEWTPLLDLVLLVQTPMAVAARCWLRRRPPAARAAEFRAPAVTPAPAPAIHADRS